MGWWLSRCAVFEMLWPRPAVAACFFGLKQHAEGGIIVGSSSDCESNALWHRFDNSGDLEPAEERMHCCYLTTNTVASKLLEKECHSSGLPRRWTRQNRMRTKHAKSIAGHL